MFDRLSSLAQFHRRPVVVVAVVFFALAGALGGSVADRLDPYGADDPSTPRRSWPTSGSRTRATGTRA